MDLDLLIHNGTVVDGTGAARVPADVGIRGEQIVAVGKIDAPVAARTIDATGLVVAPGFIDIHTHADIEVLVNPRNEAKLMQGVTTEVFSNCGLGFAPVSTPEALALQRKYLNGLFGGGAHLEWNWTSTREFLERYRGRSSANIAYLVPHGSLRVSALAWQDRAAQPEEVKLMERLLEESLESGAWGFSTGLFYRPMNSASVEECISLGKTVARHEGFFAIHLRDYQRQLLDSVAEAFQIAEQSGVRLQLSHLQAPGKFNKGRKMGEQLMALVESAWKSGLDVMCDLYPYTAGCTMLVSLLPSWVTAGEVSEALSHLRDPDQRLLICEHLERTSEYIEYAEMYLCGFRTSRNHQFEGECILNIARSRGRSVPETICELLAAEEMQVAYILHQSSEEDLRTILAHPSLMIGSDSVHLTGHVHPRVFGTYPRVLAEYVRRLKVLTLEDAVRKMSGMPAERLGLKDRGYVRSGLAADLVLFDPDNVEDCSTYNSPREFPRGIPYVVVNGTLVKDFDRHTGALPGHVLQK